MQPQSIPPATVTLTGSALTGIDTSARHLMSSLPQSVRLGCILQKPPERVLRLSSYLNRAVPQPPPSINRREKAAAALARMYLNDRYGCCVISGKAHALGLWSIDTDSGGIVQATDQEIYGQYQNICGPGDNGCFITRVLDVMKQYGFVAGGKNYKIDGYVAVDHTDPLEVKVTQILFGASTIGFNLPQEWTQSAIWKPTNSPIIGGHDVTPIDFNEQGVFVSSWGRIYLVLWEAFISPRWITEYYAILAPLWYGSDKLAPNGIDAAALMRDLVILGRGDLPDITPPRPPDPPTPSTKEIVAIFTRDTTELGRYTIPGSGVPVTTEPQVDGPATSKSGVIMPTIKQVIDGVFDALIAKNAGHWFIVGALKLVKGLVDEYLSQPEAATELAARGLGTTPGSPIV